MTLRHQAGQTLVEYLLIVALIAIGSIAIMRSLSQTIYVRFTNITNALQNKDVEVQPHSVKEEQYKKKGLDDFFKGAAGSDKP